MQRKTRSIRFINHKSDPIPSKNPTLRRGDTFHEPAHQIRRFGNRPVCLLDASEVGTVFLAAEDWDDQIEFGGPVVGAFVGFELEGLVGVS